MVGDSGFTKCQGEKTQPKMRRTYEVFEYKDEKKATNLKGNGWVYIPYMDPPKKDCEYPLRIGRSPKRNSSSNHHSSGNMLFFREGTQHICSTK